MGLLTPQGEGGAKEIGEPDQQDVQREEPNKTFSGPKTVGENKAKLKVDPAAAELVEFYKTEINKLEAKVDDKQKIIGLLEKDIARLEKELEAERAKGSPSKTKGQESRKPGNP